MTPIQVCASELIDGMDSVGTSHHILTDPSGDVLISSLSPALGGPATQSGVWNITSLLNPLPSGTNVIGGVTGTFWQSTQPVSAASLPLPTGAATAANQPGFGTAGTPSVNVVTIQGITGGTPQSVATNPVAVTLIDRSILTLTAATQVAPINNGRKSIELQNNNTGGGAAIWISFITTTPTPGGTGCFQIPAGGASWQPPTGVIYTSACYAISGYGMSSLYAIEGS